MAFRIILKKSLIIALAAFMIILPQPGFSVFAADDATQGKGRPLTVYYMCGQDDYTYEKYLNTGIIRDDGTGTIKVDLDDKDPFIWLGYYYEQTVELADTDVAEIINTVQEPDRFLTYYLSFKQAGTATFNITIPGVEAEEVIVRLGMEGICVSAGAACASLNDTASHVLTAIGLSLDAADSSIRISINEDNTEEEIDMLFDVIRRVVR